MSSLAPISPAGRLTRGPFVVGVLLLLAPIVIALGFSIWTATRPSVPAKP